MDEQVSASMPPEVSERPRLTPEQVEALKAIARERAVQATVGQMANPPIQAPQPSRMPPNVVYVRRNLTVAELLLILLVACGLVTGTQFLWNFASRILPQIEVRVK